VHAEKLSSKSMVAGKRDRWDVVVKYQDRIEPERLIFIDNTWTKAKPGTVAELGKITTFVAALSYADRRLFNGPKFTSRDPSTHMRPGGYHGQSRVVTDAKSLPAHPLRRRQAVLPPEYSPLCYRRSDAGAVTPDECANYLKNAGYASQFENIMV
jgi:hypothetical protein